MLHVGHLLFFSGLLAFFFAFLVGHEGRRLRYGLTLWGILAGAGLLLGLIMYPFS
jgi:hypothetical protein